MSEWISVEDRLPTVTGMYIAHIPILGPQSVACCEYLHNWRCFVDDEGEDINHMVTHWMELPPPPL